MKNIFIFFLVILFCSCQKSFDNLDEFEKYVKGDDYPYLQTVIKNGVKVSVRYMPADAMMINSYRSYIEKCEKLKQDTSLKQEDQKSKIDKLKEELKQEKEIYNRSIYFFLTIGYEDEKKDIVYEKMISGFNEYSQWLQKLMFGLKEYIYLQTALIDEIPVDTYQMDRTYGMTKSRTILLMFPKNFNEVDILDKKNKWLKFKMKEFGLRAGRMTFKFDLPFNKVEYGL